jgi:hypothetical protein
MSEIIVLTTGEMVDISGGNLFYDFGFAVGSLLRKMSEGYAHIYATTPNAGCPAMI